MTMQQRFTAVHGSNRFLWAGHEYWICDNELRDNYNIARAIFDDAGNESRSADIKSGRAARAVLDYVQQSEKKIA